MRSLGWRSDVMIRRLMGSHVDDRDGVTVVHTPANPTFHWGNYLLLPAPLDAADADRLRAMWAAEFPEAAHVAVGIDTVDGALGHPAVAAALGAVPQLSPVMTASTVSVVAPTEFDARVEIRQVDVDADQEWEQLTTLRRDLGDLTDSNQAYVLGRIAEVRAAAAAGHGAWWAGFVDGVARAELGIFTDGSGIARYQHVGTHPHHRRRRLASALLTTAGAWALSELPGVRTLVIIADADGPAAGVYRRLGFTDREWSAQLYRDPEPA